MTQRQHASARAARARLGAATLVVAAGMALSGCGASGHVSASSEAAATSTAPGAGADAAMQRQVMAAYRGWRAVEVAMLDSNTANAADEGAYSGKQALSLDLSAMLQDQRLGIAFKGSPATSPQITAWSPATAPTGATITDCFDGTHWQPYYLKTGKSALVPGQRLRYVQVVTAENLAGTWKITNVDLRKDQPC